MNTELIARMREVADKTDYTNGFKIAELTAWAKDLRVAADTLDRLTAELELAEGTIESRDRNIEQLTAENARLRSERDALAEDAAMLDWCESNSKDMGSYFEVRTGDGIGGFRKRIAAAMKDRPVETYTQEELDAAKIRAAELHRNLRVE